MIKTLDRITTHFVPSKEITTYSVYQDEFRQQMEEIKQSGATVITPDQLLRALEGKQPLPPKSVIITFDDIDISVYKYAFPILKEMDLPFTIFIISGEVGNPRFKGLHLANWEQIQEMNASGLVTIGSHTDRMHYLTKSENPPFMDPHNKVAFEQDAKQSVQTLQAHLGSKPLYFAYPYGFGSAATDQVLTQSGFRLIFTLAAGIEHASDSPPSIDRLLITR
ncbi:MAG: polysaccharide deacetylase family protein [Firmicutes bacterium]|nr:polysaccharide deacetylase family protein [Bacillota bacterium]